MKNMKNKMIIVGSLDPIQLPGEKWVLIPSEIIYSAEYSERGPKIAAPLGFRGINWRTVCKIIDSAPFVWGYIGSLKIKNNLIFYDGLKTIEEISRDPQAVLDVTRSIVAGAQTMFATELSELSKSLASC